MPQLIKKIKSLNQYQIISEIHKAQIGYRQVNLPTRADAIQGDKDYIGILLTEVLSNSGVDIKDLVGQQRLLLKQLADDMLERGHKRHEVKLLAAKENGLDFILQAQNDLIRLKESIQILESDVENSLKELEKQKNSCEIDYTEYAAQKERVLMGLQEIKNLYLENGLKITNSRLLADATKIQIANIRNDIIKNEVEGIMPIMNIPIANKEEDNDLLNMLE